MLGVATPVGVGTGKRYLSRGYRCNEMAGPQNQVTRVSAHFKLELQ